MSKQKDIKRAFKLYKKLDLRMDSIVINRRGNNAGIATGDDEPALRWQKLCFRKHVIDCYILDDSINWFFAKWLDHNEMLRRNKAQHDKLKKPN